MRNGYSIDTLTSVDIQEIVKIGGKVIQFYEGVIYKEDFRIIPFRKVGQFFSDPAFDFLCNLGDVLVSPPRNERVLRLAIPRILLGFFWNSC